MYGVAVCQVNGTASSAEEGQEEVKEAPQEKSAAANSSNQVIL